MADYGGQPPDPWSWVPPDWSQPVGVDPLAVALPEYSQGLPPPPPPPPPVQKIGPNFVPSETAGPVPAAQTEIEMPPDPVGAQMTPPRAPSVGNVLGEIAEPGSDAWPPPEWGVDAVTDASGPMVSVADRLSTISAQPAAPVPSGEIEMAPDPMAAVDPRVTGEALAQDPLAYLNAKQDYENRLGAYVGEQVRDETARDDFRAERNRKAKEEAFQRHKADMAALDTEWKALANKKIDPGNWWSTRSGAQKFAAIMAAVVGGLVQGRVGGPNVGLDMIQKYIDQDIEAQKANLYAKQQNLQNRKGLLAEAYAMSGDEFRAAEATRAAMYQQAIRELQTRAQQFDPNGSQALKHAETIMGLKQRQAQALQAAEKASLERREKEATVLGKELDNASKIRKAQPGPGPTKLSRAWVREHYGIDPGRDVTEAELDKEITRRKGIKDLNKPEDGSTKQADLEREQGVGGVARVQPDGSVKYDKLRNADGSVWVAPKERAPKILDAAEGLAELTDALEQLKRLREEDGGTNKWTSPSAEGEAQRLRQKAVIAYGKVKGQSLSDEQSQKAVERAIFGGDPTGYAIGDVEDRITKSITEAKASYVQMLRQAQYDGSAQDALSFLNDRKKAPEPKSEINDLAAQAAGKNFTERHEAPARFAGGAPQVASAQVRGGLERLGAVEKLGNMALVYKNQAALEALRKLAKEAPDEAIREAAQIAVDRAQREAAQ